MGNEIKVRYSLSGFKCDPEEITRLVGLRPSKTWRMGDLIEGTIRRDAENGWRIDSGLPNSSSLEEHLDRLLTLLEDKKENIAALAESCYSEVSCIVYAIDYVPALTFEKEHLRRIVALGACIDIDLYCMMKEE